MNEELNKKLAEWAGFREGEHQTDHWYDGRYIWRRGDKFWRKPDNNGQVKLPNFTESLDTCFKWLVPKLRESWQLLLYQHTNQRQWEVSLLNLTSQENHIAVAETPALALCQAILKLIDKEK